MNVYIYDKTFDGLLTAVFDAYFRKTFPDALLSEGDALPLFYDELHTVVTDEEKANVICTALCRKFTDDEEYLKRELEGFLPKVQCLELTPEHITGKLVNES